MTRLWVDLPPTIAVQPRGVRLLQQRGHLLLGPVGQLARPLIAPGTGLLDLGELVPKGLHLGRPGARRTIAGTAFVLQFLEEPGECMLALRF